MGRSEVSVAKTRGQVLLHFTAHEATAPERAIGFNPTQDSERVLFDSLRADGTLREASPGLHYADEAKLSAHRSATIKAGLGIGAAIGAVLVGAVAARAARKR